MNTFAKCAAAAALLGTLIAPMAAQAQTTHHGINWRLHHQNARIEQGERSGSLTYRESNRVESRDARIRRQEARMRASGGRFTPAERRRLQHELNHTSGAIYRQKHDAQHRDR